MSEATKYSAGSLVYAPSGDCDGERFGTDHFVMTADGNEEVCCAPDEEAGRLFAAAPDLLVACESLLADADASQEDQAAVKRLYEAWRMIRTAVAKAKGGA